jgi:hypothetical protein
MAISGDALSNSGISIPYTVPADLKASWPAPRRREQRRIFREIEQPELADLLPHLAQRVPAENGVGQSQ